MRRRNLLKGLAAAGAVPVVGMASAAEGGDSDAPANLVPDEPVVVDGLFAGTIRDSQLEGMSKAGVDCGVAGGPRDIESFSALLEYFDTHSDELVHAKTVADIRRAKREGKISNVFCWQYASSLGSKFNEPLGRIWFPLRGFQEIGLRIIGLCYNVTNAFGGGNLEPEIPLTRAGRKLVEQIHDLRMVLDVGGHTGEQTSLDAIAMAPEIPVVCTHTNIASIADNYRCISDRVIDAIAATGGVIGISAVNDFHVRERGDTGPVPHVDIEAHVDQYDYIKNRVGVEHVGMGTDFVTDLEIPYGTGINLDIIVEDMIDEPWKFIKGFESIEEFPNLVDALHRRGWTQREIDLAMGENWLRVYETVWGA